MAEGKKSFVLYCDQRDLFSKLSDEQAGKLIKHIFSYVCDENPVTDDFIIDLAFTPIKTSLKRDLKKFETVKHHRSELGKKGAAARWHTIAKHAAGISEMANDAVGILPMAKMADSVSDSVNDNVNVSDSVTNTGAAFGNFDLKDSNLYRKPTAPTFEQVHMAFASQGGTKEQAEAFFNKHDGTGWYLNGSPIVKFASLIPNFLKNWNSRETGTAQNAPQKPKIARIEDVERLYTKHLEGLNIEAFVYDPVAYCLLFQKMGIWEPAPGPINYRKVVHQAFEIAKASGNKYFFNKAKVA